MGVSLTLIVIYTVLCNAVMQNQTDIRYTVYRIQQNHIKLYISPTAKLEVLEEVSSPYEWFDGFESHGDLLCNVTNCGDFVCLPETYTGKN